MIHLSEWLIIDSLPYRLKQRWIQVTLETQVDELIKAVRSKDDECRTMVFANTVEAVEAVTNVLLKVGIECYRYHKDFSLEERAQTLADFQGKGGILVCTDAAARGVDIPNVSHVIQVLRFLPNYLGSLFTEESRCNAGF